VGPDILKPDAIHTSHGRRLRGDLRDGPPNLRWGTAHASVPPIFGKVVLLEACESTNRKENGIKEEMFFYEIDVFLKKRVIYVIYETAETGKRQKKRSMTKKGSSEIFGVKMEKFFPKKGHWKIWSAEKFFRPPQLGARFPLIIRNSRPTQCTLICTKYFNLCPMT